jgi:hypothetical protein
LVIFWLENVSMSKSIFDNLTLSSIPFCGWFFYRDTRSVLGKGAVYIGSSHSHAISSPASSSPIPTIGSLEQS